MNHFVVHAKNLTKMMANNKKWKSLEEITNEYNMRNPSKSTRNNYNHKVKVRIKQIFSQDPETWVKRVIDGRVVLWGLRRNKNLGGD